MLRSLVYKEESLIGEVEVYPKSDKDGDWMRELRISHFSKSSDRSPPLAVLYTIAADGFCFKLEWKSAWTTITPGESPMASLHVECIREMKTAIVQLGNEELHLVALPSRTNPLQCSCFWGFVVPSGLYNSCLLMLNLRCLSIVFDLDETLVVANTMRSFEDRINNLMEKISKETDQQRLAAMLAEVKRYQEDKSILKQFTENDQIVENGEVFKVQTEMVPNLSENHQQISRPIIRLPEKNIILTRINPAVRDTSVLVRVRPAWEELRRYLTARGRKRFEVFVCTMAERSYAFEIWRLLDPKSSLINSNELENRIVCVNSELKKSLLSVFQDGKCHPKMALVIDDRLTVWDSKDKPRVHLVPAFSPYYAPHAEVVSSVAVLCLARNVACNVRGGFFKEYDEGLLPRITVAYYEDGMSDLPSSPDVSNYLILEEDLSIPSGKKDPPPFVGMAEVEVERRLKDSNCNSQPVPPMVNNSNHMQMMPVHHGKHLSFGAASSAASQVTIPYSSNPFPQDIVAINPLAQLSLSEPSLQGSPGREEGEVNESEIDLDTRRRLLILQHGDNVKGTPPFQSSSNLEVFLPPEQSVPSVQSPERWHSLEEEAKLRQVSKSSRGYPLQSETTHFLKRQSHMSSLRRGEDDLNSIDKVNHRHKGRGADDLNSIDKVNHRHKGLYAEVHSGCGSLRRDYSKSNSLTGEDTFRRSISTKNLDGHMESAQIIAEFSKHPVGVIEGIAAKCGSKVEYRTTLLRTVDLQFSVEAVLMRERMGEGIGRTRKEAQKQAAMKAIQTLANYHVLDISEPAAFHEKKLCHAKQMKFFGDSNLDGNPAYSRNDSLPKTLEDSSFSDYISHRSMKSSDSVATLKEMCIMKGFTLAFKADPSLPASSDNMQEVHALVEVEGQVLGKGTGISWSIAKLQGAEEALANLKSMIGQFTQK